MADPPPSTMEANEQMTATGASAPEFAGIIERIEQVEDGSAVIIHTKDGKAVRTRCYPEQIVASIINHMYTDSLTVDQIGRALLTIGPALETRPVENEADTASAELECATCGKACKVYVPKSLEDALHQIKNSKSDCSACIDERLYKVHMHHGPQLTQEQHDECLAKATSEYDQHHPESAMHGSRVEDQKPMPPRLTQEEIDQCEASAREEASLDVAVSTLTEPQAKACKKAAGKEYWKKGHHKATNPSKIRKQEADEAALVLKKKQELAKELGLVGKLDRSTYDQKAQILAGKKKTAMLLQKAKAKAKQTSAGPGEIRARGIKSLQERNVTKMLQKLAKEWAGLYVKQDDLWKQVLLIPSEPNPGSDPKYDNKDPEVDPDLARSLFEDFILDNVVDSDAEVDGCSDVLNFEVETSDSADADETLEPAKSTSKRKNPFEERDDQDESEDHAKIKRLKTADDCEEGTSAGLVATSSEQSPEEHDGIVQPGAGKLVETVDVGRIPGVRTLLAEHMAELHYDDFEAVAAELDNEVE